jgi:proteic killer suppression protein
VNITFKNQSFGRLANDDRGLQRTYGQIRAKKIRLRLTQIHFAAHLEELRPMPGRFHELTANRKGQWACDLDQPYRMIFIPHENPIPTNSAGHYLWKEIRGVEIVEIENYHKNK